MAKTRLEVNISLELPGKRAGDIMLRWSDNARPLGVYPIPVACVVGKPGPTALLVAGVHGDEFEGPVALHRLFEETEPDQITGRLIILPAFNCPAILNSQRVSPRNTRPRGRMGIYMTRGLDPPRGQYFRPEMVRKFLTYSATSTAVETSRYPERQ